jgi:hypothetical protein
MIVYLNDRNWSFVPLRNTEIAPIAADRRVGAITQDLVVVNKSEIIAVSILDVEEANKIQVARAKRPVVFHAGWFAVRGNLHIREDAPDEDLLDEMHDFYPISKASVYPIKPVAEGPNQAAPLLLINRPLVKIYHSYDDDSGE